MLGETPEKVRYTMGEVSNWKKQEKNILNYKFEDKFGV